MPSYKVEVVAALLSDRLDALGRGSQTRLADAIGVRVQTVNKWAKAQTMPEPAKWPAIEDHLDLPRGTIRKAAGFDRVGLDDGDGHRPDLEHRVSRIETRLEEMEGKVDQILEEIQSRPRRGEAR